MHTYICILPILAIPPSKCTLASFNLTPCQIKQSNYRFAHFHIPYYSKASYNISLCAPLHARTRFDTL